MSLDAALEQVRKVHLQLTKELEERVHSQEEQIIVLKSQLSEARTEAEEYKSKYLSAKTDLKRYADKFAAWKESIKRAKQEKKRASLTTTNAPTKMIDIESNDSSEITPPSIPKLGDSHQSTSSGEPPSKKRSPPPGAPAAPPNQRPKVVFQVELDAEFPLDSPPQDPSITPPRAPRIAPAPAPNNNNSTTTTTLQVTSSVATPTSASVFKYTEVVRKKKERESLPAAECDQCKHFLDALTSGSTTTTIDRRALVNLCSRHRDRFERPPTPPGFWDLSFPQGADRADDR